MDPQEDADIAESWVELTPQSLGYLPANQPQYRFSAAGELLCSSEAGGFHTLLEEQLLTRLLSEAQDHSDRASEATPPSPPPSRQDATEPEQTDVSKLASLGAFSSSTGTGLVPLTTVPGEWPSRPEAGRYLPVCDRLGTECSPSPELISNPPDALQNTWSLRSSAFMKSHIVVWILDHIPSLLSHAAAFLLGAVVSLIYRKRKLIPLPSDYYC